jgi:hypothetical protein
MGTGGAKRVVTRQLDAPAAVSARFGLVSFLANHIAAFT